MRSDRPASSEPVRESPAANPQTSDGHENPSRNGSRESPEDLSETTDDDAHDNRDSKPQSRPAGGPDIEVAPETPQVASTRNAIEAKGVSSSVLAAMAALRDSVQISTKLTSGISASYRDALSAAQQWTQRQTETTREVILAWNETLDRNLKQWQDAARRLSKTIGEFSALVLRFKATVMQFRWPPPTGDFDASDMQYIVDAGTSLPANEAEERITAFMLERHDSGYVQGLLEDWKHHKWIKSRVPILAAVVDAHNRGLYELSIPALLPQVEGIIWEGYGYRGRALQKDEKDLAKELCSDGLDFLDQIASDFFVNTLLQEFELGQPAPGLSRHAILHGADTRYATAANSLKLILLFDYLLNAFGVVSLKDSSTYHKLGCPHVQHSAERRTVYSSHTSAQRAGKKPCKSCHPEHL